MAYSSGVRHAARMAAGWLVAGAAAAFSLLYFAEIKESARGLLGLHAPAAAGRSVAAATRDAGPATPAAAPRKGRQVEIKAGSLGHYHARAEINGRPIDVMVDSGASIVALSSDDARRAGLHVRDSDYTGLVNTANGVARIAPVTLDRVSIGDITVRNVEAAVMEPGKLATSLLGMSFLNRLQRVDMRGGVLVLQE
jgi:aspartyl protease family protein